MREITCHTIQDLLPLYVEQVLSEDSVELVEEHLKECADCRAELHRMQAPVVLPDFSSVQEQDSQAMKKLRGRLKRKRVVTAAAAVLGTLTVLMAGWLLTKPTSVEKVLERVESPFAVGTVLAQREIDDVTTLVLYQNKENPTELQNMVIRRTGPFYRRMDLNGTLLLEKPQELKTGELRSRLHISWYERNGSQKYVAMAVAFDEQVTGVSCCGQPMERIEAEGYQVFLGFGVGDEGVYQLFDANGEELGHYAP